MHEVKEKRVRLAAVSNAIAQAGGIVTGKSWSERDCKVELTIFWPDAGSLIL